MQKTAKRWAVSLATSWIGLAGWIGASELDAAAGTLGSPGCQAGGQPATVAAADASLDLHLSDGRIVQLAGIHTDASDRVQAPATLRTGLGSWLEGASVTVAPLREEPDRWGRTVALVFAPLRPGADTTVSVGEAVLDAGLATLQPDPRIEGCWTVYQSLENAARQTRVGLWEDGDALLDPADHPALLRHLGSWTLVEGRIGAVREGRARTYIRFDRAAAGFAVAIDHAAMQRLTRTLGAAETWVGRKLLARGLLDDRWGLQIDVTSPQQVSLSSP